MKAIVLTAYGDVDKLELSDVPEPNVGANDVKVRVVAASINPVDWKLRSGALKSWMPLELPAVLGRDVAGEVVEVGAGVRDFAVGDRVLGLVHGGYAERVVAPATAWAKAPAGLDLVEAAALPLVALTGTQLIDEAVAPHETQIVLVTGALGGVGRAAVFAAKARGAHVWAGVRAKQREEAAKLGAEGVVAIDDDGEIAMLPPLDAIADTVGGPTTAKLLDKVKRGGVVGSVVGEPAGAKERGITVHGLLAHEDAKRLADLALAATMGKLVIPIARKFPLAEARAAQAFAEKGAGGKVLLIV